MSIMAIIGLILLVVIVVSGILIKTYTKRTLKDMDGIGNVAVIPESQEGNVILNKEEK